MNKPTSSTQQQLPSPSVLKLYVRIQDKVLLIPVERSKSVQWLSDEAARRYYNMTGLNPVLSLHTMDGAVLNGEDEVTLILQDGDKLVGEMVKWDLQPLPERYANLCRQLEIGEFFSFRYESFGLLNYRTFFPFSTNRGG